MFACRRQIRADLCNCTDWLKVYRSSGAKEHKVLFMVLIGNPNQTMMREGKHKSKSCVCTITPFLILGLFMEAHSTVLTVAGKTLLEMVSSNIATSIIKMTPIRTGWVDLYILYSHFLSDDNWLLLSQDAPNIQVCTVRSLRGIAPCSALGSITETGVPILASSSCMNFSHWSRLKTNAECGYWPTHGAPCWAVTRQFHKKRLPV